ncbi:MAG: tetratricopeptide repeat-containing sulfotransferase family protein [Rhodanobacteraceae bacterium]
MLRGDLVHVELVIARALQSYSNSFELRRLLAGVYRQTHREAMAESLLAKLHAERPGDAGTAFTLARMLVGQCRSAAASVAIRTCLKSARHDMSVTIQAIELLDECGRKHDAAAIADDAIIAHPAEPRLHAYAGMLEIQLGEFGRARAHYLFALEHDSDACEWHVPHELALMQRYHDAQHPDFACFRACLKRSNLTDKARSSLLLALAKAHDDVGEYAQAAEYSRQANILAHAQTQWSRKQWRRAIEARLNARPAQSAAPPQTDFVPVFIVGVPRSGTTLVSALLARYPRVCNRGESPWLAKLAQDADLAGTPDRSTLQRAAMLYAAQLRQDDTQDMRWFIDKQPLNFRYVDLMLSLFPDARIIYCRRNARDTALSLWMQAFHEEVQGYACAFTDIALVLRDCERLMAHWCKLYPDSIREARYEQLATAPETTVAELAAWIGLPASGSHGDATPASIITTSSLWQARQPVYTRSVGRWKNYVAHLPELLKFEADASPANAGQLGSNGNIM